MLSRIWRLPIHNNKTWLTLQYKAHNSLIELTCLLKIILFLIFPTIFETYGKRYRLFRWNNVLKTPYSRYLLPDAISSILLRVLQFWTLWSVINLSEIIHVISKSKERAARVLLEITYDFWPKLHSTEFNHHFTSSTLYQYFIDWVVRFFKDELEMLLYLILCVEQKEMRFRANNSADFPAIRLFTLYKRCFVLVAKIVRLVNKSHHWEPIRLQG